MPIMADEPAAPSEQPAPHMPSDDAGAATTAADAPPIDAMAQLCVGDGQQAEADPSVPPGNAAPAAAAAGDGTEPQEAAGGETDDPPAAAAAAPT
jgi:hypothetical protein